MPTYNTRKARRIIQHLRRYGMDGIVAKALAKCGAFRPEHYCSLAGKHDDKRYGDKRTAKAQRRYDRAELAYKVAYALEPKDHGTMAWALAEQAIAKPYLS